MKDIKKRIPFTELLFLVLLVIYPLRHVYLGVDLMDAGYNYTNFMYNKQEYMGSMWFFATWSANMFGNILIKLPYGNTMLGMNIYTSLIISLMAVSSYLFFTRKIRVPKFLTFMGEILAISLCWLPSGVLYTYLTYVFFLAGSMFLYIAITENKEKYYVIAGICLGFNVSVRFSNLVQMGMIVAVWFFGIISKKKATEVIKNTIFCVLGYMIAIVTFVVLIHCLYGVNAYIDGIGDLFGMTQYSQDYAMDSMLWGMISGYFQISYWVKRWILVGVVAMLLMLVLPRRFKRIKQFVTMALIGIVLFWCKKSGFIILDYASYFSVYYPCILLLLMTLVLVVIILLDKKTDINRKLQGVMLLLYILLSSLGSNNALFSTMNNLFFIIPCLISLLLYFIKNSRHALLYPFKMILISCLVLMAIQGYRFGWSFVYEEAAGARDLSAKVENVPMLKGMYTGTQKAKDLENLYNYLQREDLNDKECILIGDIPGLAYYMDLEPGINVWCDLRSYSPDNMREDMQNVISTDGEYPIIIIHQKYMDYIQYGNEDMLPKEPTIREKLDMLNDFIRKNEYMVAYNNNSFVIFE